MMQEHVVSTIRRAYSEAALAAKEKGLTGIQAASAVRRAAAKVATKITGVEVTEEMVEEAIRS